MILKVSVLFYNWMSLIHRKSTKSYFLKITDTDSILVVHITLHGGKRYSVLANVKKFKQPHPKKRGRNIHHQNNSNP